MAVISRNVTIPSGLNPNAPMFVPAAYRAVEDFSDEWWALVHSSPWFQDYWFQYLFQDPQTTPCFSPIDDHALPDLDSLFQIKEEDEEERDFPKEIVKIGASKWQMRNLAETPRFPQKAPKIVNKKMIPRPIQQPR